MPTDRPITKLKAAALAALVSLSLLLPLSPLLASPASAGDIAETVCRINWTKGRWHLKQLIKCAEDRWSVPGGARKAIAVARCQSDLRPRASRNGNAGVFQHRVVYWPDRADAYGFEGWSVFNGRANVIVSIRMAHRSGWGPWSCA